MDGESGDDGTVTHTFMTLLSQLDWRGTVTREWKFSKALIQTWPILENSVWWKCDGNVVQTPHFELHFAKSKVTVFAQKKHTGLALKTTESGGAQTDSRKKCFVNDACTAPVCSVAVGIVETDSETTCGAAWACATIGTKEKEIGIMGRDENLEPQVAKQNQALREKISNGISRWAKQGNAWFLKRSFTALRGWVTPQLFYPYKALVNEKNWMHEKLRKENNLIFLDFGEILKCELESRLPEYFKEKHDKPGGNAMASCKPPLSTPRRLG